MTPCTWPLYRMLLLIASTQVTTTATPYGVGWGTLALLNAGLALLNAGLAQAMSRPVHI